MNKKLGEAEKKKQNLTWCAEISLKLLKIACVAGLGVLEVGTVTSLTKHFLWDLC